MGKLVQETIETHVGKDSVPDAFIWRKRLYRVVEVLSRWHEPVDWWNDSSPHFFIRVNARNITEGTYELCQAGNNWFLHKVID